MKKVFIGVAIIAICVGIFVVLRNAAHRGDVPLEDQFTSKTESDSGNNGNNDESIAQEQDTSTWTLQEGSITKLPPYPGIPLAAPLYSSEKKKQIVMDMIDHKLSTYPKVSVKSYRVGKFSGTGLATQVTLRDDQLKILAQNYDYNQLAPMQLTYGKTLKKYAPHMKLFMYFDSGIQADENIDIVGDDAGNIDAENVEWLIKNHPDWLLTDVDGKPLVSAHGTLSNAGEYWGDPGNPEFQEWFAGKINKAMAQTGNIWDGVLLDQFFGKIENYTDYAGTNAQTKYKTNAEYQAAALSFLKRVSELVNVPVMANLDGSVSIEYPEFFVQVGKTAGGIESEIYPFENSKESDISILPVENLKSLIDGINQLPKDKYVKINSKPGGLEGNTPRTLYAYYTFLLIADKNRDIYWAFKEGDSSIPHYWYREFDLDLGDARGKADTSGALWTRSFDRALLVVNPQKEEETYTFTGTKYTLLGQKVSGSVGIPAHTGVLLFPDEATLLKAKAPLDL